MNVAFIIYTNMTALDFIGVYDPITRLKSMAFITDLTWEICAFNDTIIDHTGLKFHPTVVQKPLTAFDLVIVPGGITALVMALTQDTSFIDWLRTAAQCPLKASVCTGSLLFGAAGFLGGKQATTHPNAFSDLQRFCSVVTDQRIVDAGDVITARGVTASIDLGLYLCAKIAGLEAKERIRTRMDYPYGETGASFNQSSQ